MAKITKIQKAEIIKLAKQGYKTKDIACRFDVKSSAITYIKDQYIIHGEKIFYNDVKLGRRPETDNEKIIKKLQEQLEIEKLVNEHQKKVSRIRYSSKEEKNIK